MRFYNFDTGELDTHTVLPDLPDEWEPYIPILRRTEFWLRLSLPDVIIHRAVFDILNTENNKPIPAKDIIPELLAIPTPSA